MIDIQKTILITGASGFVGANLLRSLLEKGAKNIHLILRENSDVWRISDVINQVTIHYCALDNFIELSTVITEIQPRIIYHLAAAGAYIGRDASGVQNLFATNVLGTINLVNACKSVGFDYFINTGSNSEYGEKSKPMHEDDILEPNNEYGVTKASATLYCSYLGKKEQLPIYTFRLFAVFGYFEDHTRLIPSIMKSYAQMLSPSLSSPTSVRDFIFIEDVIQYYLHIDDVIENFGGVFNIGSGVQYTIDELVGMIQSGIHSSILPTYGTQSIRQKEPKTWVADMEKTHMNFPSVQPTKLEDALLRTYKWFTANLHYYV